MIEVRAAVPSACGYAQPLTTLATLLQALQTWPIPPRAYEASSLAILSQAVQAEATLAEITLAPSDMSALLLTADKLVANLRMLALDDGLVSENSSSRHPEEKDKTMLISSRNYTSCTYKTSLR
jgi:hypothetical protein